MSDSISTGTLTQHLNRGKASFARGLHEYVFRTFSYSDNDISKEEVFSGNSFLIAIVV
ncbi:hypothetical protein CIPAW_01G128400 [Carya illinoinensis]|uniref:Uncharacterized protein n=1 Tax=Carya illinoinensis TaxID=32201 RepID=A0A8T1RP41_CARIL|nr:hypothetical protein CIPAW_01G128400 [Carya illinoinensis]